MLLLVESFVQLSEFIDDEAMRQDDGWIELAALNLLEQFFPVFLDWCLACAAKGDAFLLYMG
jgi:hypothetical protein